MCTCFATRVDICVHFSREQRVNQETLQFEQPTNKLVFSFLVTDMWVTCGCMHGTGTNHTNITEITCVSHCWYLERWHQCGQSTLEVVLYCHNWWEVTCSCMHCTYAITLQATEDKVAIRKTTLGKTSGRLHAEVESPTHTSRRHYLNCMLNILWMENDSRIWGWVICNCAAVIYYIWKLIMNICGLTSGTHDHN